jgi:hypothetical protein
MKTSETIGKLSVALLTAQKAITFAAKDASNPFFKSKYADLPTVIDAVKPALNDAGIVFIQSATPSESGTLSLTTRLIHESGEWLEDTATAPLQKNDPQGYGSAITYLRRYSLAAITGLYQDDDDGQAASQPEKSKPITPLTGAWEVMDEESQKFLQAIADDVIETFKVSTVKDTVEILNRNVLDNDEKSALWTRFDSKLRAAIKKYNAENKG